MHKKILGILFVLLLSGCEKVVDIWAEYTPAHIAVRDGDLHELKKIISKDKSLVSEKSTLGFTPLYIASMEGHSDIVSYLLSQGADIEVKNHLEERPLAKAVKFGHIEVARILIDNGAEVNAQDFQGLTALHWSISNGSLELVKLLVLNGADVTIKSSSKITAVEMAFTTSQREPSSPRFTDIANYLKSVAK